MTKLLAKMQLKRKYFGLLPVKILLLGAQIGFVLSQDNQPYFFGQTAQGRFVPSFHNPRTGFFSPTAFGGLKTSQVNDAPSSSQEQSLFLGNETPIGRDSSSSSFNRFSPFQSSRNQDFFDNSPRPFGVSGPASSSFSRPNSIRPSGSGGFFPSKSIRTNVPHQQSQFLAHFNEQSHLTGSPPTSEKTTTQSSRVTRPLGSGFSRHRQGNSFNRQTSDESFSTQQQLPLRNGRNRFQPNADRTTSTTTTTTTTEKTSRYNRFGSGRSVQAPKVSTSSSSPALARPTPNKTLFQPRRPVFISREVNEPVHLKNRVLPSKITINHNGGNNSHDEDEEEDVLQEEIHESNHVQGKAGDVLNSKEIPVESYEKLGLHEPEPASSTTQKPGPTAPENSDPHTVILTSNFFLPQEQARGLEEDSESGQSSLEEQVQDVPATTINPMDYEYEYEDYDDNSTTITASANDTQLDEKSVNAKAPEGGRSPIEEAAGVINANHEGSTDSSEMPPEETTLLSEEQSEESSTEYDEDDTEELEEDEESNDETEEEGSGEPDQETEDAQKDSSDDILGQAVVQVITTKSVINGSTAYPQQITPSTRSSEDLSAISVKSPIRSVEIQEISTPRKPFEDSVLEIDRIKSATESYILLPSISTARSFPSTRFLPYPIVEPEQRMHSLDELEANLREQNRKNTLAAAAAAAAAKRSSTSTTPRLQEQITETTIATITDAPLPEITTEKSVTNQSISTESIIDKLDRVQSELSSGLLSGKFPILNEMPELEVSSTVSTTTSTTAVPKFVPNIRKFVPKTTTPKPEKKIDIDSIPMDDLTGLLPPGFKPRVNTFRNRKLTTSTTTTTEAPKVRLEALAYKPSRNTTIGRSFKSSPVIIQDIGLAGLVPKGYKVNNTVTTTQPATQKSIKDLLSKIKFEDNLEKLLPKDYKEKAKTTTTKKPSVTIVDDTGKFLPPGFKHPASTTTNKPLPVIPIKTDIKNLLPPGYDLSNDTNANKSSITVVPLQDDLKKFLPPGYEPKSSQSSEESASFDISQLLPKGYKPKEEEKNVDNIFKKIEFKDVASLLPPGFKDNATKEDDDSRNSEKSDSNPKVVFPKGLNKRPGVRLTTPKTPTVEGPTSPQIVIKKGPPTRATTEFTGWPTPSTTPFSIEKLLEQQRTAAFDISNLLPSPSTTTVGTTTTTTTQKPPKPTEPGLCHSECDLAGTIKIIDGVKWKPELLDHNTDEWKTLAREVEAQLNEVYSSAPRLSKWYKKVRIDSFNKGSVLVDYFVELSNISDEVDTLEIKQLFHEALSTTPLSVIPLPEHNETFDDNDVVEGRGEKLVKETYLLGRFVVDPVSTDFIVIPKPISPTIEFADEELLIPQWAIVVIVIGVGSLAFIVIFGVTVLVNRQKRAKKTPTPLTNDMLHELNKNHMGGTDNYGADEFYNVEDTWNDTKQPIKPKRFTNSMHGSSASNIYDSWRSQRGVDYYYDNHNYTAQKLDPYPPDAFSDAHQMYTYNPRSRYYKDYEPDF